MMLLAFVSGLGKFYHHYFCFIALLMSVLMLALDSLLYETASLMVLISDIIVSNCLMLMFIGYSHPDKVALILTILLIGISIGFYLLLPLELEHRLFSLTSKPFVQIGSSLFCIVVWILSRPNAHRHIISNSQCRSCRLDEYYRMTGMILMLTLMVFSLLVCDARSIVAFISMSLSLMVVLLTCVLFFLQSLSGSFVSIFNDDLTTAKLRAAGAHYGSSDEKMKNLYERVCSYMEETKPFLREDFEITDLAASMYSNKTYLSKTINVLDGRNFRQFVNGYRIDFALNALKDDPGMRMSEVADFSGFHNVVTFNMAFKLVMGQTPGEWSHSYHNTVRLSRHSLLDEMSEGNQVLD